MPLREREACRLVLGAAFRPNPLQQPKMPSFRRRITRSRVPRAAVCSYPVQHRHDDAHLSLPRGIQNSPSRIHEFPMKISPHVIRKISPHDVQYSSGGSVPTAVLPSARQQPSHSVCPRIRAMQSRRPTPISTREGPRPGQPHS